MEDKPDKKEKPGSLDSLMDYCKITSDDLAAEKYNSTIKAKLSQYEKDDISKIRDYAKNFDDKNSTFCKSGDKTDKYDKFLKVNYLQRKPVGLDSLDDHLDSISTSNATYLSNMTKSNVSKFAGVNFASPPNITAKNISEIAFPIVTYIHKLQPDYIVACDRGARLIGFAVKYLYNKLHGKLPTVDGSLRFRRISKSNSQEQTAKYLKPLVREILTDCDKRNPVVLVLDDWVASGSTKRETKEIFNELGEGWIDLKFGVLVGDGADVAGTIQDHDVEWHDNPRIIGVDYEEFEPRITNPEESAAYRQSIIQNIDEFVNNIGKNQPLPKQRLPLASNYSFKEKETITA